jgi:alpha-beta hydrolase superfamily lysophospholipase
LETRRRDGPHDVNPTRTGEFTGQGGLRIHWQSWEPENEARAFLLVAHGYGEHGGRYAHVGERFAARGVSVTALDHRGHGRSQGQRGHVNRFREYVNDLHALRVRIAEEAKGRPIALLGHSMGGLVAIHYALAHGAGLAGICLSAPALGIVAEPSPVLRAVARLLAVIAPRASFRGTVDPAVLSHDLGVGPAYVADPLVHRRASARFYVEFKSAIVEAHERAAELDLPLLFLLPEDDRLTDPKAARDFAIATRPECTRAIVYPGFFHEVLNEVEKERVFVDLERWLEDRLVPADRVA